MRHFFLLLLALGLAGPQPGQAQRRPSALPPAPDSLRPLLRAATTPSARAGVLLRIGQAFFEPFDSAGVVQYAEAAEQAARRLADNDLVGRALDLRGEYYRESGNLRQAAPLLQQAEQLLAAAPRQPAYANVLYHRAMLYGDLNRFDQAHRYFRQALGLFRHLGDAAQAAEVLNSTGLLFQKQQQPDSATWYLFGAVRAQQQLGRRLAAAAALGNLGLLYAGLKRYPEAARYLRQGYAIEASVGDSVALAVTIQNLGTLALLRDSLPQALGYLHQGLRLKQRKKLVGEYYYSFMSIGESYRRLHRPDSAIAYFRRAISSTTRYGRPGDQAQAMTKLAQMYQQTRHPAEAAQLARQVLALGQRNLPPPTWLLTLRVLQEVAAQQGNYPQAYTWLQQIQAEQQQQQAQENQRLTEELRVGYETEQAEQRVMLLEKDRELTQLRARQQAVGGALLVALALALAGALVWRYRQRQRRREAALRHQLAADLHDDVGSLLSRIALQTDLLQEGLGQPAQWAEVAENSRMAVRQLNEVVWNLDAENDSIPNLLNRLRDYAYDVLTPTGREVHFVGDEAVGAAPELLAPLRRQLYLIFKEALHNILKYAPADATVTVGFHRTRTALVLKIVNSGPPAAPAGRSSGHGLRNIQARVATLGGTATAGPVAAGGFAVVVQVPL
ncbi:MAG: tetratricopeptide repeat-containing sensor histidine kinase [Janthinobacterium lividum]